jgi:hypothetical protein
MIAAATGEVWLASLPNHHRALILDERPGGAPIGLQPGERVTVLDFDETEAARRVRHEILMALMRHGGPGEDGHGRGGPGDAFFERVRRSLPLPGRPRPRPEPVYRILPVPPVIRVPRPPQRTK